MSALSVVSNTRSSLIKMRGSGNTLTSWSSLSNADRLQERSPTVGNQSQGQRCQRLLESPAAMASVVPTSHRDATYKNRETRASGVATRIFPAMPPPVVRDYTVPSCITASRHGFRALPPRLVCFELEITVVPSLPDNDKKWRKCKRRSSQASASCDRRGERHGDHLEKMGARTQAKYLAELFGLSSPAGWPVVWTGDHCRIFYPPDSDHVNVVIITNWARQVSFEVTSREGGIQLCAPLWQEF